MEEEKKLEQNDLLQNKLKANELEQDRSENKQDSRKIEVVAGDGEDLTISPVYEHLEVEKPKPKENRHIIIPEVKDTVNHKKEEINQEENN